MPKKFTYTLKGKIETSFPSVNMKKYLLVTIIAILAAIDGIAQWDNNPAAANTPFCTAFSEDDSLLMVSDGGNGVILAWQSIDYFAFSRDLFAQRIDVDGLPVWGTASTPKKIYSITDLNEAARLIALMEDGNGGAYAAWHSYIDTFSNIFIQHLDANGNVLWGAAGIKVNHDNIKAGNISLCKDGAGGVVVSWDERIVDNNIEQTTYAQIFAQRYSSAGAKQWNANGVQVCTAAGLRAASNIINDAAGGFICVFADARNSAQFAGDVFDNLDMYAQRINANGNLLWPSDAVVVSSAALNQLPAQGFSDTISTVADGTGGAILLFEQYQGWAKIQNHFYAQRINSLGSNVWPAPVPVCMADSTRSLIKVTTDGAGGMIAVWSDNRQGNAGIYTQKITANGTAAWATDGLQITPGGNENFTGKDMAADGKGNYIFTWSAGAEVRAQKINSTGNPQWNAGGKPVCTNNASAPKLPAIVKSNGGNAIIGWADTRNGIISTDIYGAKIGTDGNLTGPSVYYITKANGNWNAAATWTGNTVPPADASVIVRHNVNVTADASCNALSVEKPAGKITVNTGFKLTVLQ